MQLSAQTIAQLVNGTVEGDPMVKIDRPSPIEEGGIGTITFLGNMKYESYLYNTTASIVIIHKDYRLKRSIQPTLIRVHDVYASVALLQEKFSAALAPTSVEISDLASIDNSAIVDPSSSIGDFVCIGEKANVGANCKVGPQVFIGDEVSIGENCIIYPGVRILQKCQIGSNCIIHSNAVIGSDGFGFAPQENGTYKKIPQLGNVILEDHVEVGANVTIDRASMGSTIIKSGAKLDNLIHVAHNVKVGKNTVVAAQAGVAGSTEIGENCQIGGQVGFVGHIKVANGTRIQAQSGIAGPVEQENSKLFGSPAIEYNNYLRSYAIFKKLPELYRHINKLAQRMKQLENRDDH